MTTAQTVDQKFSVKVEKYGKLLSFPSDAVGYEQTKGDTIPAGVKPKVLLRRPLNKDVRSREYLTLDEINALRKAAKELGRHGQRDALLILVMFRHALRVGEAVDLRWDQFDLDNGRMQVNRLKNGTPSVHFLEGDEIRALRDLKRRQPSSLFVFLTERKGPMTVDNVQKMVKRAGERAAIPFPVHPHMLRHSKGYNLVNKGEDTRAIQMYFGHRDIKATTIYTQLDVNRFKGFGKD